MVEAVTYKNPKLFEELRKISEKLDNPSELLETIEKLEGEYLEYKNPRLFENYDKEKTTALEVKLRESDIKPDFTDIS